MSLPVSVVPVPVVAVGLPVVAVADAPDTLSATDAKRLLLVATPQSYRLAAYVAAAAALNIELTVAAQGSFSLTQEVAEGIRLDPDNWADSLRRIRQADQLAPFHGVVATDDAVVEQTALIAQALGLACNSATSARLTRRKDLARQCLKAAGVSVPEHCLIDVRSALLPQLSALSYPVVLKPVSLSASQGVIRVDNLSEAEAACAIIMPIISAQTDVDERNFILAESYLPGKEVALEGFLCGGELQVLAIFDKPDPLEGPYFEESYYITPSRHSNALQRRLIDVAAQACQAYGLLQGPVHIELRFDTEQIWIIEVAGRTIGGECSRVLDSVLERPLEQFVVAAAVGQPLALRPSCRASGVLMIPIPRAGVLRRIAGAEAVRKLPGITGLNLAVAPGQVVQTLPEAASYLGFIFASAASADAAEALLRRAHAMLEITIDPLL